MSMPGQRTRGVLLKGVEGLPIQVPQAILHSQARLGPVATLVWINLLALAQLGRPLRDRRPHREPGAPQVGGEQGPGPFGR